MDDLDHKILQLLAENARMPVKDIAQRVSLTRYQTLLIEFLQVIRKFRV